MTRWPFDVAAALSLLLSLAAAAAWATSHARPLDWHLLGTAHSADLTRAGGDPRGDVVMIPAGGPGGPTYGYWDALWVRSEAGRLSLAAQAADYDGALRALYASPPSLVVELPGPARARAVAFDRPPESRPRARRLGFAWDADAQQAVAGGGAAGGDAAGVRAWTVTLPHWLLVLLGLPLPLLWLRARRRSRG